MPVACAAAPTKMLINNQIAGLRGRLEDMFEGAEEIHIATAYISPGACEGVGLLLRASQATLRLAIGRALKEGLPEPTWEYLRRLDAAARPLGGGVRLSEEGFHSKLYAVPGTGIMGSSNLTEQGISIWTEANLQLTGVLAGAVRAEAAWLYDESVDISQVSPVGVVTDPPFQEAGGRDGLISLSAEPGATTEALSISLLDRSGEMAAKSGLYWGLAKGRPRDRYECYIRLPVSVAEAARATFGSLVKGTEVVANTHDGRTLVLCLEGTSSRDERNAKQISTPGDKAALGRWMVAECLGIGDGSAVVLKDLLAYGRTDVVFYRTGTTIDGKAIVYLDFSPRRRSE